MYIHHVHICTTKTHYIVYVYNVSAQSVYRRPLFHRAHTQKQEFDIYTKVSCASQKRKVPVRRYSKEYFESLRSYLNEKKKPLYTSTLLSTGSIIQQEDEIHKKKLDLASLCLFAYADYI